MRIFHAQILDKRLEGNDTFTFSDDSWTCMLSRAESIKFSCIADQVTGTSPQLGLAILGAADSDGNITEIIKWVFIGALNPGTNSFQGTYSAADTTWPPPKHLWLAAQLQGSADPAVRVQVWICGRGPATLETMPGSSSSFAAQLAAARMCDDENRLTARKRLLRPGASLFYPPELFEPSIKWDR